MFWIKFTDWVSHIRYKIAFRTRLSIDVLVMASGVAISYVTASDYIAFFGLIFALIGAALMAQNLWREHTRASASHIIDDNEYFERIRKAKLPSGFHLFYGSALITSDPSGLSVKAARPYIANPELNSILNSAKNAVTLNDKKYVVPSILEERRLHCVNFNRPTFNSSKIGLRTDLSTHLLESNAPVMIQKTDYFSSSATNEMAGRQFVEVSQNRTGRPRLLYAVSDLVIDNRELIGLHESALSNHIGVSTLVLTADNYLALQVQGEQTDSPNEIAAGASGSADFEDYTAAQLGGSTLQGLVRYAMEREAGEELSAVFRLGRNNTTLTGYARYLARGAKPEFFGISRTTSKLRELRPKQRDKRFVLHISGHPFQPTDHGLLEAISSLLEDEPSRVRLYSLSMVVCLKMAQDYLSKKHAPLFLKTLR